jgi:hypothetical protein
VDISSFTDVQALHIHDCPSLLSVPSLNSIKELSVFSCESLSDMRAVTLDWKDYMKEKRTVSLSIVPCLADFSFCRNIYSLDLSRLLGLKSCAGISNIHHLVIYECKKLITMEGLGLVTGKIVLDTCPSLITLIHVKNIPEVHISRYDKIRNFNDLGNHELVQIQEADHFEKVLQAYQREGKHKELFSSIRSLFWASSSFEKPVRIW